jgi:hypothetical protein
MCRESVANTSRQTVAQLQHFLFSSIIRFIDQLLSVTKLARSDGIRGITCKRPRVSVDVVPLHPSATVDCSTRRERGIAVLHLGLRSPQECHRSADGTSIDSNAEHCPPARVPQCRSETCGQSNRLIKPLDRQESRLAGQLSLRNLHSSQPLPRKTEDKRHTHPVNS